MWKVFRDDEGWFVSFKKPFPMPSRRRATKAEAEAEAKYRNEKSEEWKTLVHKGLAGSLPGGAR